MIKKLLWQIYETASFENFQPWQQLKYIKPLNRRHKKNLVNMFIFDRISKSWKKIPHQYWKDWQKLLNLRIQFSWKLILRQGSLAARSMSSKKFLITNWLILLLPWSLVIYSTLPGFSSILVVNRGVWTPQN